MTLIAIGYLFPVESKLFFSQQLHEKEAKGGRAVSITIFQCATLKTWEGPGDEATKYWGAQAERRTSLVPRPIPSFSMLHIENIESWEWASDLHV